MKKGERWRHKNQNYEFVIELTSDTGSCKVVQDNGNSGVWRVGYTNSFPNLEDGHFGWMLLQGQEAPITKG